MSRKQVKLSVDEDLYNQLSDEAEERNLPISTFARLLISRQLEMEEAEDNNETSFSNKHAVNREERGEDEGVIMLSDVLKKQPDENTDSNHSAKSAITEGVNISIVINK